MEGGRGRQRGTKGACVKVSSLSNRSALFYLLSLHRIDGIFSLLKKQHEMLETLSRHLEQDKKEEH